MRRFLAVLSTGLIAASLLAGLTAAAEQPLLATAGNYAVIAATAITNTGPTTINGNLAISPSGETSVTGFGPGVVTGTSDFNNAAAIAAQVDLGVAYAAAESEPFTVNLTGQDLGGLILTPGVYRFDSSAQLTGTLILDGEGSTNPTFIFQMGRTLTTASASSVVLINGAGGCAVFWQVGSSATLGPPGWHAATAANATQPSSYLDHADQPEDYQNDDDHADDSYATAHLDLLFTKLVDEA